MSRARDGNLSDSLITRQHATTCRVCRSQESAGRVHTACAMRCINVHVNREIDHDDKSSGHVFLRGNSRGPAKPEGSSRSSSCISATCFVSLSEGHNACRLQCEPDRGASDPNHRPLPRKPQPHSPSVSQADTRQETIVTGIINSAELSKNEGTPRWVLPFAR